MSAIPGISYDPYDRQPSSCMDSNSVRFFSYLPFIGFMSLLCSEQSFMHQLNRTTDTSRLIALLEQKNAYTDRAVIICLTNACVMLIGAVALSAINLFAACFLGFEMGLFLVMGAIAHDVTEVNQQKIKELQTRGYHPGMQFAHFPA